MYTDTPEFSENLDFIDIGAIGAVNSLAKQFQIKNVLCQYGEDLLKLEMDATTDALALEYSTSVIIDGLVWFGGFLEGLDVGLDQIPFELEFNNIRGNFIMKNCLVYDAGSYGSTTFAEIIATAYDPGTFIQTTFHMLFENNIFDQFVTVANNNGFYITGSTPILIPLEAITFKGNWLYNWDSGDFQQGLVIEEIGYTQVLDNVIIVESDNNDDCYGVTLLGQNSVADVIGNRISCTADSVIATTEVTTVLFNDVSCDKRVKDNVLYVSTDVASTAYHGNVHILQGSATNSTSNIEISNNVVQSGNYAILIDSITGGDFQDIRNVIVSDNLIKQQQESRASILISSVADTEAVKVSDNIILDASVFVDTYQGIYISGTAVNNISVTGNNLNSAGFAATATDYLGIFVGGTTCVDVVINSNNLVGSSSTNNNDNITGIALVNTIRGVISGNLVNWIPNSQGVAGALPYQAQILVTNCQSVSISGNVTPGFTAQGAGNYTLPIALMLTDTDWAMISGNCFGQSGTVGDLVGGINVDGTTEIYFNVTNSTENGTGNYNIGNTLFGP